MEISDKYSPLVSVIVPNYNHARYLEERLKSIFNQTYSNFEVILLDDCSTDNSIEILKKYITHSKVSQHVFNKNNSGNTFNQWKSGISLAKGDLIWIAESDDYSDATFLEKLIKPFQYDDQLVLSFSQSNRVNEFSEVTGNWITHTNDLDSSLFLNDFSMDGNDFIEKFLIFKNVIPNASAVLFKKNIVNIEEHFDISSKFKYCGDWMFYSKIIINKKVAFVSESLNNFRYHSTSAIAKALQSESRIVFFNLDLEMRLVLNSYLFQKKVSNYEAIAKINHVIMRNNTYEKSMLLIRNGNKFQGYLLLITVFNVFYKKYNFKKNIKIKMKNLFKWIFKE